MTPPTQFDRRYYERFYLDPKTRVTDQAAIDRLGDFVCTYLQYLPVPVTRALDLGCGIGMWRTVVGRHFPHASYQGVEVSEYLCERYGWQRGSVVDYRSKLRFDLVICQGVLPYLPAREARQAIDNLATLCRGALYLEAITTDDYENGVIDRRKTDPAMKLRSAAWYRRALAPSFVAVGGGVWVARRAKVALYQLEQA
ncbi:MAG: methyltransferase type 11 [Myxococcaceae bacterium]|nr:methyltransferase type 11 [Myxococcaceae bacterium]